ncbi:FtsK/SpoIIIE domain-containing protein [Jiangella rhizosphaerae]|nr:FtsK/SpoIIIE domain-containing protein [Jiangella rhizosphaerae]
MKSRPAGGTRTAAAGGSETLVGGGLPPTPLSGLVARLVMSLALAVMIGMATPMLELARPAVAAAVAVLVAIAAACSFVVQLRARARQQECDRAIEALARHLRLPQLTRRACRASRWRDGWVGVPDRVVWQYGPGAPNTDSEWLTELVDVTGRRFGGRYEVAQQKPRQRRVYLVRDLSPASASAGDRRVKAFSRQIFGAGSKVAVELDDDGEIAAFEVRDIDAVKFSDRITQSRAERKVSNLMPDRFRAKFDVVRAQVRFERRPTFPESVWIPVVDIDTSLDVLQSYDQVEIQYAVDEDRNILAWSPAIQPNLMLIGTPGTGKTVTAHTLLVQASRYGWPIWVVDGKSIEFLGFQDWPNVQIVATTTAEQVAVIERAHALMEYRYQLITKGTVTENNFEPLLLFLDEWADFRANLLDWYADVKPGGRGSSKPRALSMAASIARKGRSSRVHLVFGTQRPDAEYFTGDMRDNFPLKISMGRLTPQAAMMAWESPVIGTTIPRKRRGRATTVDHEGMPIEAQCYRTPDPRKVADESFEAELLDKLRPAEVKHPRLLIVPPELDPANADRDDDFVYADYASASWVLASSRPDLDPVAQRRCDPVDGRTLSSPLTMLGLGGDAGESREGTDATPSTPPSAGASSMPSAPRAGADDVDDAPFTTVDDGYDDADEVHVGEVKIGDLVLVDDALEHWAVVVDVGDDLIEPDCVAISWRDDHDGDGELTVSTDDIVIVRKPSKEPLDA